LEGINTVLTRLDYFPRDHIYYEKVSLVPPQSFASFPTMWDLSTPTSLSYTHSRDVVASAML
jgi:hypothetical protein